MSAAVSSGSGHPVGRFGRDPAAQGFILMTLVADNKEHRVVTRLFSIGGGGGLGAAASVSVAAVGLAPR